MSLVEAIEKILPDGYSVNYEAEYSTIEVNRGKPYWIEPSGFANMPPPTEYDPRYVQHTLLVTFRVVDYISPDEHRRLLLENKQKLKKMMVLYDELERRHVSHKFDSFSPGNEADHKLYNKYKSLKDSRADLPVYHYKGVALNWVLPREMRFSATGCRHAWEGQELEQVLIRVFGVMTKYQQTK